MSGTDPPLIAGKIHGLRVWNISWKDGMLALTGQAQQVPWRAKEPTKAKCQSHRRHRAPREGCGCGLYALHPTRNSAKQAFRPSDAGYGLQRVAGIVEAWGTVEVHKEGFRAEYARPFALILPRELAGTDVGALIEQLATRYDCQVLELDGHRSLYAFCERHNLGLSVPVVRDLLAPKTDAAGPAAASSATAGPWQRAVTILAYAVGGLWWLFWLGVVVAIVYGIAVGGSEEEDKPQHRAANDHRRLELIEQSLVDLGGGDSLYIAVVKNRSHTKTAFGVYPRGSFLGRRDRYIGSPSWRTDVESRPNLAPRQTGVIFDYIVPAAVGQARGFKIKLRGTKFRERAKRSPVTVEIARFDRRRCLITARIRSSRPIMEAGVAFVAKDRRGKILGGTWELVGPLPRGVSTQVVDRVAPRPCRRSVARVDVYADLSARQLRRRSR
jgi:hypothetical protein